jgi:hypothetical protein
MDYALGQQVRHEVLEEKMLTDTHRHKPKPPRLLVLPLVPRLSVFLSALFVVNGCALRLLLVLSAAFTVLLLVYSW